MSILRSSSAADLVAGGLRFECQGCGACCRGRDGYVFIAEEEARTISAYLKMDITDFYSTYTRKTFRRVALVDNRDGDCCFLEGSGCIVYQVRPYQCRSWPFWFKNIRSQEDWERVGRECPGVSRGRVHSPEEIIRWLDGSPFLKAGK